MKFLYSSFVLLLFSIQIKAQNTDQVPWSHKQYLKSASVPLNAADKNFSKTEAEIQYQILMNKYERDKSIERIKSRNNKIRIYTEGSVEVINQVPFVSIGTSMLKEKAYQHLARMEDESINPKKAQFNHQVKELFDASSRKTLQANENVSFDSNIERFKVQVQTFKNSLGTEDYQVIAPQVDQIVLDFIQKNNSTLRSDFERLKQEVKQTPAELEAALNSKMQELQKSTIEYDKAILEKVAENAEALNKFSENVNGRLNKQKADMEAMKKEVEENNKKIKENKEEIERVRGDLARVNQLTRENRELISENSYKIDVITDVLYDNVNTAGKRKLLALKYKNDLSNPEYVKEDERLDNIETVEKIKSRLEMGQELVTLGVNLGMSPQDAAKANKALEIGNVIANGAMAYFTGNPIAGLQAVNGAFALFGGGGSQPNPEFAAIMEQFRIVNQKLDQINKKIDMVSEQLTDLRQAIIELHYENQKRFDRLEEQLAHIQTGIDNITQLIYSKAAAGLMTENTSQYNYLWQQLESTKNLDTIRRLYQDNTKLKNAVDIVYKNTENRTISDKLFLHYNLYEYGNFYENMIYKPMKNITLRMPKMELDKLEFTTTHIYDYRSLLNETDTSSTPGLLPRLNAEANTLIYPQAVITLTDFMSLFEPYYYFSSANENHFGIATQRVLRQIDYSTKNRNLKNQFENILKENRTAILQAHIISGIPMLTYIRKHIEDPGFETENKKDIYKLLTSDNYYLKVNLVNDILYQYIHSQDVYEEKFYNLLTCKNEETLDSLLKNFNTHFSNPRYRLEKIKNHETSNVALVLKIPEKYEIPGNIITLPIPPFDYIYENRALYPSYINDLYKNEERLINKIIKYDIVEKINTENFINLKRLK